jgi:hypothetical protein
MQRFFVEGTNRCTLCDCVSWNGMLSFHILQVIYLLKEQIVVLWLITWLENVLHILFLHIYYNIERKFCVMAYGYY